MKHHTINEPKRANRIERVIRVVGGWLIQGANYLRFAAVGPSGELVLVVSARIKTRRA